MYFIFKNSVLYGDQLIDEYKYPIIALSKVKLKNANKKNESFCITGNRNFRLKGDIHEPFYFSRKSYIDEVKEILNQQKNNLNLSSDFINSLVGNENGLKNNSIIFSQRAFEEGPGNPIDEKRKYKGFLDKLGKDIFYNEQRMWKSSIEFDLFFIITELSKISISNVTKDTLKIIFNSFYNIYLNNKFDEKFLNDKKDSWSKTKIKNFISEEINKKISKDEFENFDFISFEPVKCSFFLSWCNLFLKDDFIKEELEKFVKDEGENKLNEIGKIIAENITPWKFINELKSKKLVNYFDFEKINKYLKNDSGLNKLKFNNDFEKLAKLRDLTPSSPSNISAHYFKDVLKAFLQGERYGEFQANFLKDKENNESQIVKKAFGPILDSSIKDNPVVCRSLSQSRKVVKALYDKYKWFDNIIVETARELSKSIDERNKIVNDIEHNYEKNLFFKNQLKQHGLKDNGKNIEKIKLWYEQNFLDAYTLEKIKLENLDNYDVDHIMPRSQNGPDIFDNKVLTLSSFNRNVKINFLPLQIDSLSSNKENFNKANFIQYVKKNKNFSKRKKEFLLLNKIDKEKIEGLSNKELTDTRYISKIFTMYLKKSIELYCKENEDYSKLNFEIFNVKGEITSTYRKLWLNKTPWGLDTKPRNITHFHHAVDAIILANFSSISKIEFYTDVKILMKAKWDISKNPEINGEIFDKVYNQIYSKWSGYDNKTGEIIKTNLWFKNSLKIFEEIKNKSHINLESYLKPIVDLLDEHITERIPVKLSKEFENFKGTFDDTENDFRKIIIKENSKTDLNVKVAIDKNEPVHLTKEIPKFEKIINENEYDFETLKSKFPYSNIRYPMVSWMQKNKINNNITGSDELVSKKEYLEKKDSEKNNIYKISKSNSTDYINVSSYYGTLICKTPKNTKFIFKPIRNIYVMKTHKYINCTNILRHNSYFEVKEGDTIKIYKYDGVDNSSNRILCSSPLLMRFFAEKKLKDYRISPSKREFKFLKYDILGNKIS